MLTFVEWAAKNNFKLSPQQEKLADLILSGKYVVVSAPRRYGKLYTQQLLNEYKKGGRMKLENITIHQYNWGAKNLLELSNKLNIGSVELAKLLLNINELTDFWKWVNTEDFLYTFLQQVKEEEENGRRTVQDH